MPSFAEWLKASWEDFRRRWAVLLMVAGAGGVAAFAAGALPFAIAVIGTIAASFFILKVASAAAGRCP